MRPTLSATILCLLTVTTGPVAAQPASTDLVSAQLVEEMEGIRQALDRLVAFRESTDSYQQAELVMKRIELSERRLSPLEGKLFTVEAAIEKDEENLQRARLRFGLDWNSYAISDANQLNFAMLSMQPGLSHR